MIIHKQTRNTSPAWIIRFLEEIFITPAWHKRQEYLNRLTFSH